MPPKELPNLVCHGHTRPIVELSYSPITPDGYFISTASKDGKPMLRNGDTGDWIGTFEGHKGAVWSCVLNAPALVAATASADYTARVWNALTGDELYSFDHGTVVRTCAWAADAHRLVTGGMNKQLRVYDLERADAAPACMEAAPDKLRATAWCDDDKAVLASYMDRSGLDVWDVRSGKVVKTIETEGEVTSVEVGSSGRFVTIAYGKALRVMRGGTYDAVHTLSPGYNVESASYCPERARIVAGGEDMWVHLYDAGGGGGYEELRTGKGHHGPVHCVRFAPTHDSYTSGSEDGTLRIWQMDGPEGGKEGNGAAAAAPAAAADGGGE